MQQTEQDIEMVKRRMILRDFQKGLSHIEASNNIELKYGTRAGYGTRTCERWFTKFRRKDFDLTQKPRDKPNKDYTKRKSKKSLKTVKSNVSEIKFRQTQGDLKNVRKSNIQLKLLTTGTKAIANQEVNVPPKDIIAPSLELPKLRPRRPRSKGIEIQLSSIEANNMKSQTLTESHSIGQGNKEPSTRETTNHSIAADKSTPKEVTVQFHNLNPNIAKNTIKKPPIKNLTRKPNMSGCPTPQNTMPRIINVAHIDSMTPIKDFPAAVAPAKRDTAPQPSLLNKQNGVIYLNPQEIFPKSFGRIENTPKRPSAIVKSIQQTKKYRKSSNSLIQLDSDGSEEDVLFPENISLPAPKIKTNPTFETYWDMGSGKLIQINPEEPVVPTVVPEVIEID